MVDAAAAEPNTTTRLNHESILQVAEEIAAAEGTRNLTLRRLGDQLGVNHTAVYRYFRNKDELLVAVADRVLGRSATPVDSDDPREMLRRHLRYGLERYSVHPELAQLIALRPASSGAGSALTERALTELTSVGLTLQDAARVFQLMESLVVGFGLYSSLQRVAVAEGRVLDADMERRQAAALPTDRYPLMVSAAPYLYFPAEAVFEDAVDLLLAEVERLSNINNPVPRPS